MVGKADRASTPIKQLVCKPEHIQQEHSIMEDSRAKIRAFIAKFFQNINLQDDEDIFALGFINSLFAMQLVLFVESEFALIVDNEDLDIDNFRTINAIVQLIERKTTSRSSI
jgi:methoxymalonate biosynthesis acyl carrier protein